MDIEHGPDAPRLRDSPARCIGRVGIVELANRPDAVALDVLVEIGEYLPGLRQEYVPVDIETCLDVELQQPGPCRTVLAREIAFCGRSSLQRTFVEQVAGRECPQPLGGEQVLAHGADHLQLQLLVEHLVIQPAGDDHVGARRFVGPVRPYEIGQITFRQAEQFDERRLRACRERLPGLDEGFVCVFAGQFERITYGVVPQGVHLYLVTVARSDGAAVDHGIHPRHRDVVRSGPHQSVVMQRDAAADSPAVALQNIFHGRAVGFPYLLAAHFPFELLERPEEPQRGICRDGRRGVAREHAVAHFAHQRVEGVDTVLLMPLFERDARERYEGLAPRNPVPRVARHHFGAVAGTPDDELPRRMLQAADEVDLVRAPGDGCGEYLFDGLDRTHFVERSREDDAFALLEFRFEIARREQVFVTVVTARQILLVFESVVPVGCGHELRAGLAGLQV